MRLKREEGALLAALDALEKIDPAELSKLGDGKLEIVKEYLAKQRGRAQTFQVIGTPLQGPPK